MRRYRDREKGRVKRSAKWKKRVAESSIRSMVDEEHE